MRRVPPYHRTSANRLLFNPFQGLTHLLASSTPGCAIRAPGATRILPLFGGKKAACKLKQVPGCVPPYHPYLREQIYYFNAFQGLTHLPASSTPGCAIRVPGTIRTLPSFGACRPDVRQGAKVPGSYGLASILARAFFGFAFI